MAKLKIIHQVPGRIRMKIPSAKGNEAQLQSYKDVLGLIPGVEDIEVNPVTGSIILKYDADQHGHFRAGFHDHLDRHHSEPPHGESRARPQPPTNEIDAVASPKGWRTGRCGKLSSKARSSLLGQRRSE